MWIPKIGTKPMSTKIAPLALLLTLSAFASISIVPVDARITCGSTEECQTQLHVGSECRFGFCSNPFAEGCLKTMIGSLDDKELAEKNIPPEILGALEGRVCNSDDAKYGTTPCLANEFDYFEIRVHNANWEASMFVAWIMQIVLMEVLKVPVTIGMNSGLTSISSFYSPTNTLEYSSQVYPWEGFREDDIDCKTTDETCIDVMPEVWNGQFSKWISLMQQGLIEPVDGSGQVGKIGWFIPTATARIDDSLLSFYGLQGEENRAKLAQTFKRPTTWYEYCEEVSINNCTTPDNVAEQYPETEADAAKFFKEGQFTGYFRMLPENDCTVFPETCTGYIVGPQCTWSTNVDAQLYWNNIVGLKPDGNMEPNKGYEYSSQVEIWRAANATKSDVIMWWWQPDVLVEEFSSTDFSFQQIVLPTVTDVCFESRIEVEDRCVDDIAVRRGDPKGACDYEAHALQKVISSNLQRKTLAQVESSRSPGYSFIRSLKVSDLQIQSLLKKWMAIDKDKYGNDARLAVCSWVVDHLDTLVDFIPPGHPRSFDPTGSFDEGYLVFAMVLSAICFLVLLAIAGFVYQYRLTKVFVYAQSTLIQIILLGLLLVIVGAFLCAVEPTNAVCAARIWLTSLGFSIVLGVVLVKMSTINRIRLNAKKLKRVKVSMKDMVVSVGFLVSFDLILLITWTAMSPPQAVEKLELAEEFSTTVKVELTCRSEQAVWPYLNAIWHAVLIIVASVLAFQSRGIIPEFNESRSIGTMIYSHFLFLVFRLIVFFLAMNGSISSNIFGASISFLHILDAGFATAIYVIPKCIEAWKNPVIYKPARGSSGDLPPREVSMVVNMDQSQKSVASNLRGRHQRRRRRASHDAPISSGYSEDSIHEEEWKKRSILSKESSRMNEDSIVEEVPFGLRTEEPLSPRPDSGTHSARNSVSSYDAALVPEDGVMADLQPSPPSSVSTDSENGKDTDDTLSNDTL